MKSTIIHISKPERYAILSHEMLRDTRLTFAARGLLAYLLSLPDNWEIRVSHLIKQSPAGRDAVYAVLKDLETFGYLRREPVRDQSGRITSYVTTVFETPENPQITAQNEPVIADLPFTAEPDTVEPDTANPHTKKYLLEEVTTEQEQTKAGSRSKRSPQQLDEDFINTLKANSAYIGIDIDRVLGKMRAWCMTRNKIASRRRLVDWLNREDRPLQSNGNGKPERPFVL